MQNLYYDDKYVYALLSDRNGVVMPVPFYLKRDFELTSQEFKYAFVNYQNCAYSIIQNKSNIIETIKLKLAEFKLRRMEKLEGITRINLNEYYNSNNSEKEE